MDRLTVIEWVGAGSNLIRRLAYGYDAAGMITNVTRETGERTAYAYDSLYRLTGESRLDAASNQVYAASWGYDLVGNRLETVEDGVTNTCTLGQGNRLAAFGAEGQAYQDAAGCVTSLVFDTSRRLDLTWDSQYQLTAVSTNGVDAERHGYDALGRRVWTWDAANGTNWMVYDGPHVVADVNASGELVRSYVWGPGIDNLLAMTVYSSTTNTYYALKDHLNSVLALTAASGQIIEQYRYDAWGRTTVFDAAGNSLTASAVGNRYCWQGREYSWKTSLYYFRARWYDPITGRWLSNDPIGISGGLNQYVFCANNPVNYRDPFGLWTEKGHNGLGRYGGGKFDYSRLDREYPASLSDPGGHFEKLGDAIHDAMEAAQNGESVEFEYAVHEVQDYYSHRGAGITTPGKHVQRGTSPDNPNSRRNRGRYKEADAMTRLLEDMWDDYNPPNDSGDPCE